MTANVILGDCLEVLKTLPDNSIDALVTDPPAGIEFMGKEWDTFKKGRLKAYTKPPSGRIGETVATFKNLGPLPSFQQKANPRCVKCGRCRWSGTPCVCDAPEWALDTSARDTFIAFMAEVASECLRVLKPGAHGLVWALPRTSHWTATALEDAGFEVRDCCYHIFGSGFPKSLDVGKQMDRMAGAEREVVGEYDVTRDLTRAGRKGDMLISGGDVKPATLPITAPATDAAKQWDGWGTALKPAVECWWLVRKPLSERNIAENVLKWGTGALNIDGSRVPSEAIRTVQGGKNGGGYDVGSSDGSRYTVFENSRGRWPPHLLLSHTLFCTDEACDEACPVSELSRQSGRTRSSNHPRHNTAEAQNSSPVYGGSAKDRTGGGFDDAGGASRFFPVFRYQPKPSVAEKEAGLDAMPDGTLHRVNSGGLENEPRFAPVTRKNTHPTVKSIDLMRWLVRLVTPSAGTVLDPFAGSGTTGCAAVLEGFNFLGCEQDAGYREIALARIRHWTNDG